MKTYYEKNFANGVLNSNNAMTGGPPGSISGRQPQKGMNDLFIPVTLSKHQGKK